jgi:hypothetical protein
VQPLNGLRQGAKVPPHAFEALKIPWIAPLQLLGQLKGLHDHFTRDLHNLIQRFPIFAEVVQSAFVPKASIEAFSLPTQSGR